MNPEMKSVIFLVVLSTVMAAHHRTPDKHIPDREETDHKHEHHNIPGKVHREKHHNDDDHYDHDTHDHDDHDDHDDEDDEDDEYYTLDTHDDHDTHDHDDHDDHDTHGTRSIPGMEEKCPAIPNELEPVSTGLEVIGLLEKCQDLSDKCDKCKHKCRDEDYHWGNEDEKFSHWTEKNCAKTCKICVVHHPKVSALRNSENVLCWKKHGGYDTQNVYDSVPFTSMNDCRDMCFADDECVGVHTTHFDREPRYCQLANGGHFNVSMRNAFFWGATRKCLEENPTPDCTDHWTQDFCIGYSRTCTSDCPTWIRLMRSVCRKTCELCSEDGDREDNEGDHEEEDGEGDGEDQEEGDGESGGEGDGDNDEEEDGESDGEGDGEGDGEDGGETERITWQIIEGRKIGNNANYVLESNLSLKKAKQACENFGEECVGLSCKRKKREKSKCEVLSNIDKQKSHEKYDVYIKVLK
ncbi:uncharacterized protein LOC134816983 [Bolinopsis microptera]|uniref:uncharacterized protein LOC134816983 n=1 Tax=Bolinopsis microptera TaxID=2820187 RepID=UPI00307AC7B9